MAKEKVAKEQRPTGRRYVGARETIAYLMFDMSASMNVDSFKGRFLDQSVNISNRLRGWMQMFLIGPWDAINDVLFAAMIDKTRTRYGKFRPYLVFSLLGGFPFQLLYFLMPLFFLGSGAEYMPKVVYFVIVSMLSDITGTFNSLARSGVNATITPDPYDRLRLISIREFWSGILGERLPQLTLQFVIAGFDTSTSLAPEVAAAHVRTAVIAFGVGTAILSGVFALYFAFVYRERVPQSFEKPKLLMNIKSVFTNRPLLCILLSEVMGTISVKSTEEAYYATVLKNPALQTIIGIPGALTTQIPYLFTARLRERFSTKSLWVFGSHFGDATGVLVALFAMNGGIYAKKSIMVPVLMVREMIYGPALTVRNLVRAEIDNEVFDYTEWKNGFRTEAMSATLKGLIAKVFNNFFSAINELIKSAIGFRTGSGYRNQPPSVQRWVFLMWLLLPSITGGVLSLIPKLFYNITQEERVQMYADLTERRSAMAKSREAIGTAEEQA
ncbi:MAG: MFS transporter [Oscillospiraceae bacterium]|nr:MFS transporter [Oscillospiraceae bacterium]